ncbi:MAG: serine/threonine protein kinase [bacterium]|nr:serine/threonine protein kinase [bacterium]
MLVTKAGVILLDFGLAKLSREPERLGEEEATLTEALTQEGTILGTHHYMAPEQWEGKEADARSDIFAFGAVLYEMLTGRKAFDGKTPASVIAAIMERDPPAVSSVQPMTPPALDRTVKRCLEKDPDCRWQSAADLGHHPQWIAEPTTQVGATETLSAPRWKLRFPWAVAAVTAIALLAVSFAYFRQTPPPAPLRRFAFTAESLNGRPGDRTVVSPNGRHIVYSGGDAEGRVWIRDPDREQPRAIEGTEGAAGPFWSPGSDFIGFTTGGVLYRVSAQGGPASRVCQMPSTSFWEGPGVPTQTRLSSVAQIPHCSMKFPPWEVLPTCSFQRRRPNPPPEGHGEE